MNKLTERLFAINTRKQEIKTIIEENTAENFEDIETELNSLNEEYAEIEKRIKTLDTITIEKPKDIKNGGDDEMESRKNDITATAEYRSAFMKKMLGKDLNEAEKRAYSQSMVQGAIPDTTVDKIFATMGKIAPLLNEITLLNVEGNVKFTAEGVRSKASRHIENQAINPANDTLIDVNLGGYEYIKIISISESVKTMTIDNFENWLATLIAEDVAVAIEYDIINGNGSNAPQGVAFATEWNANNSITYTTGIQFDDITAAVGLLPAKFDNGAKWLMNKKTFWNQVANIKDTEGNPIAVKNFIDGQGTLIMGYPLMISDEVGEGEIYLGNYKQVVGNLARNITVDVSRESGFRSASIDYRGLAVFDCKVAQETAFVKISE